MTEKDKEIWRMNIIMLLASAKLMSDQSTYLQGERLGPLSHEFKVMVRETDDFIRKVEKTFPNHQEVLQQVTDVLNNGMTQIREQLK